MPPARLEWPNFSRSQHPPQDVAPIAWANRPDVRCLWRLHYTRFVFFFCNNSSSLVPSSTVSELLPKSVFSDRKYTVRTHHQHTELQHTDMRNCIDFWFHARAKKKNTHTHAEEVRVKTILCISKLKLKKNNEHSKQTNKNRAKKWERMS